MLVSRNVDLDNCLWAEIHREEDTKNPMREWDWAGHISLKEDYIMLGTENKAIDPNSYLTIVKARATSIFGGVILPVYVVQDFIRGTRFITSLPENTDPVEKIGYIWSDKKDVQEQFSGNKKLAKKALESMINILNAWTWNEVYGYRVGEIDKGETETYSCWGFFLTDSWNDLIEEMTAFRSDDKYIGVLSGCKYNVIDDMPNPAEYRQLHFDFDFDTDDNDEIKVDNDGNNADSTESEDYLIEIGEEIK